MKNTLLRTILLLLVFPAVAAAKLQSPPAKAPPLHGFRAEFVMNLDEVEEKLMSLAEATPADKFSWRPAPGVRSVSEAYMHVAGGNYFLSSFLGVNAPKRTSDLETTVTKKADVLAELRRSFEHLRSAAASSKDLEKRVKLFGNQTTHRGVMVTMLSHLHEHLGQSIAYARMMGVTPPWSR